MANRYWVGTGTWNSSNTANWSTTSGGTTGASVPGTGDAVFFDANSTSCTTSGTVNCAGITCTGFTGTLTNNGTIACYGNVLFVSGSTISGSGSYSIRATASFTSAGKTITTFNVNGSGSTVTLQDNLSCTNISHTNGTLDLNGKTISATSYLVGSGTQNLTFNGGTVSLTSQFDMNTSTALGAFTTTAGTGTGKISFSGGSNKIFGYHASYPTRSTTFNCTVENASASQLTIYGNHTIDTISNSASPTTIRFDTSQATTVNNFNVAGTSGNLVTIASTSAGTQATLSKASGTVSVSYCSIKDSNATGGALWQAYTTNGNTNGGNNTGWDFGASGNGLLFGSNF